MENSYLPDRASGIGHTLARTVLSLARDNRASGLVQPRMIVDVTSFAVSSQGSSSRRLSLRRAVLTGMLVVWQAALLAVLVWDAAHTTENTWGSKGQTLHYISKLTFLARLAIPLAVTITVSLLDALSCRSFKWWLIFHHRFINRRMKFLAFHETRIHEILAVVCVVVSLGVGVVDVCVITVFLKQREWALIVRVTVWCLAFLQFGVLWYALNLCKCSLQAEFQDVCTFLHNNIEDVDACRERIRRARVDYKALRSFSSTYFVLHASISVFSLAAHVYYTYLISTQWEQVDPSTIWTVAMIWCETVFFLAVPVACLGGVSIDHTWHLFQIHCCPAQRHGNEKEWNKIVKYVREADPHKTGPWKMVILFTVVTLFGTLHLANQNPHFYPAPAVANGTAATMLQRLMHVK
ncbi:uncharacterized protein LOC144878117 [Branchiostoma floridae x Branchiostoma japonicum]